MTTPTDPQKARRVGEILHPEREWRIPRVKKGTGWPQWLQYAPDKWRTFDPTDPSECWVALEYLWDYCKREHLSLQFHDDGEITITPYKENLEGMDYWSKRDIFDLVLAVGGEG